jgi:hypothetical protein
LQFFDTNNASSYKIILVFCFALTLLYSCNNIKISIQKSAFNDLVIVDSTTSVSNFLKYDSAERNAGYQIYYLGEQRDTICLPPFPIPRYLRPNERDNDSATIIQDESDLQIFVDTSLKLVHQLQSQELDTVRMFYKVAQEEKLSCYALFLVNKTGNALKIGDGNLIDNLIRQAKNKSGSWIDIEKVGTPYCGTGLRTIQLKRQQIAVAKVIRYAGNFPTECRLKYEANGIIIYSNTFTDNIDEKQLLPIKQKFE